MAKGTLWKCECGECNCDLAAVKDEQDLEAICWSCSQGIHRAEREWREGLKKEDELRKKTN